jgi:hypothetical protein
VLTIAVAGILWTFDNSLQDVYNNFVGVGNNGPTYSSPGINGYGSCVYLNGTSSQSITIYSPPNLNLTYTSFSVVAWVKATSLRSNGDNAIFGQLYQNSPADKLLQVVVRNQHVFLGFGWDDTTGNRTLYPNIWYHVCIYGIFETTLLDSDLFS